MAHYDIPLDIPHAGRLSDRLLTLIERFVTEMGIDAPELLDTAEQLSNLLFRYAAQDDNPAPAESMALRDEAAAIGRTLVEQMVAAKVTSDRLGQLVRNFFECLELGEEGAEISLRAGENPNSLQRPI